MRKRRRRQEEQPESHERWLVSYADFITLLFAFFVVMYAVSSVNEGKYRVLSESLNAVFKETARSNEVQIAGEETRALVPMPGEYPAGEPEQVPSESDADLYGSGRATRLSDRLELAMQDYIDRDLVSVKRNGNRIEVEMKAQMLFGSGEARLSREALEVLRKLGGSLKSMGHDIQVEGHTDNVPIGNLSYASNWELSAARAASVVHYLARLGVKPERLSAVGYGEFRPVAPNDSAANRARNRRVTLVVTGAEGVPESKAGGDEVPWAEGPGLGPS